MLFVKGYSFNLEELRLRAKEGHTEITFAHNNACGIASKLPTAECPSGTRSGQFEMHISPIPKSR